MIANFLIERRRNRPLAYFAASVIALVLLAADPTHIFAETVKTIRDDRYDFPVWRVFKDTDQVPWLEQNEESDKKVYIERWTEWLNEEIARDDESAKPLPDATTIEAVLIERLMLTVKLVVPDEAIDSVVANHGDALSEMALRLFDEDRNLRSLKIVARPESVEIDNIDEDDPEFDPYEGAKKPDWTELVYLFRVRPPIGHKPFDLDGDYGADPIVPDGDEFRAQPTGALSGASIFVSPGHGWLYHGDPLAWRTQRGPSHGVVEDHSNAELVLQYVVPYLWNAGARVYTTRERCMNSNMDVVENGGRGYSESGEWTSESAEGAHGGSHRTAATVAASEPTAAATFTPEIPEDGYYGVYVWYRRTENGTTTQDARFEINHSGGRTVWVQNQLRDGFTWKYIGNYYFEAGSDPARGSVSISNASSTEGNRVVADAVRFGGGMGDQIDPQGETISGHPRWEESGMYYAPFMGYDSSGDSRRYNSVSAMPLWAEWEAERWEVDNSLYVSWHTNASADHLSRGLSSFVYGAYAWGPMSEFVGYPRGREFDKYIHESVLAGVHAEYDSEWRDVGMICRWLGETNPHRNKKMPAALIEVGFHDNPEDAAYILDPKFRRTTSRAFFHGIIDYYVNEVDGFENAMLLPEPPTHLSLSAPDGASGGIAISWKAPLSSADDATLGDAATGYRVYRSKNGHGFDNGRAVDGVNFVWRDDIEPGATYYFRVTATNEGGESMPSETLAVSPGASKADVLLVNGFDRMDRGLNLKFSNEEGREWERGILSKMNSYNYSIQHGAAIAAAGRSFDSVSNEVVADGTIELSEYDAVVWILGQESRSSRSFDEAEQLAITSYMLRGGGLFVSGSDAAWDLDAQNYGREFHRVLLRSRYRGDDADSHEASGVATSIFEGLENIAFGDATSAYPVEAPDFLEAAEGAIPALFYNTPNPSYEHVAAVQYDGRYRLVYMAFPFETISSAAQRHEVMNRALGFLIPSAE